MIGISSFFVFMMNWIIILIFIQREVKGIGVLEDWYHGNNYKVYLKNICNKYGIIRINVEKIIGSIIPEFEILSMRFI